MKTFLVTMNPVTIAIALSNKDMKILSEGLPKTLQTSETGLPMNVIISNAENDTEMQEQISFLISQIG